MWKRGYYYLHKVGFAEPTRSNLDLDTSIFPKKYCSHSIKPHRFLLKWLKSLSIGKYGL